MRELIENIIDINKNKFELLKSVDKPKLGWISISTPEEIVYAAGMVPFRITGESQLRISESGALLSNNLCSYVLSCLSEGMEGIYDFADGIIIADACNARRRLFDVWNHFLESKYIHLIDLAKDENPLSKQYFRLQIRKLIESIESYFNCKITEQSLRAAIALCNETRRLLQELYELRKSDTPCISGSDAINIVKSGMSGLKEEFNKKLALLLSDIKSKGTEGSGKKHRVLVCGSYFDHSNIIDVIESIGASVVCEDISNGIKYFEGQVNTDIDPVDAIADYYFGKSSCARMVDSEKRFDRLYNLITEYDIQSVIYFSLKFCDSNLMDYPYFRQKLLDKGIPMLFIEGEQHMGNIENIKTRILTFLETTML